MANYKYAKFLSAIDGREFDIVYSPSTPAPLSGIYRCEGCGREAVSTKGHHLPPQDHHQHTLAQGKIRWQPIVISTHV